ncbi:prenyltransferase/squalene oxidase repeat-containing protein [Streptomyces sp. NPDC053048]|uniref:prenyltransferase/squalene oxidase repeat-containing protein n=1 Tax=Streptomyces sp. NPDC053048 TaxID=3365694 RepID=UPI0037D5637E
MAQWSSAPEGEGIVAEGPDADGPDAAGKADATHGGPPRSPAVARNRACAFLLRSRGADGWWRDFDVNGPSSTWLTAYVGAALAGCGVPRGEEAAREAWGLLAGPEAVARGWGYGPGAPPDADTTAWVLRLAEAVGGDKEPAAARGYAFLTRHVRPDGGVATYSRQDAGHFFDRHPVPGGWDGWYSSHICVTAAAAGLRALPERERLLRHLAARQRPDGSWQSYWWTDPEYATAFAYEAFDGAGRAAEAARAWMAGRIGPDGAVRTATAGAGSAFATALAARTLRHATDGPTPAPGDASGRVLHRLLHTQRPSGDWPGSAWVRLPPPSMADPDAPYDWRYEGRGARVVGTMTQDRAGLFTTATALLALSGITAPDTPLSSPPTAGDPVTRRIRP